MSGSAEVGKKRSKTKYMMRAAKRLKTNTLDPDQDCRGFFFTHDRSREPQAIAECYNLLNAFADGQINNERDSTVDQFENPSGENCDAESDISKLIEKEKHEIQSVVKARFQALSTSVAGISFMRLSDERDTDVLQFGSRLLNEIERSGKSQSRFIQRLIPIQRTCIAEIQTICKFLTHLLSRVNGEDFLPSSFMITYKCRNNQLDRQEVLREVASLVAMKHRVNLSDPDFVIVIEVARVVCGLSVVEGYRDFREFKLRKFSKVPDEREADGNKPLDENSVVSEMGKEKTVDCD